MAIESITKFIFSTTDIIQIQTFLQQHPTLDPTLYQDKQANNILHQLSYRNQVDILKIYINHAAAFFQKRIKQSKKLYTRDVKQQIQIWINQPNAQGFTPLLYAAYNGNIDTIKYLEFIGSNINAQTKTGLNALHLAAQNNKVHTFLYFKQKINLNSLDKNSGSPLHWASYLGSQSVVSYILAQQNVLINHRDVQGQTPLMLATIYGNTKIVRKLLIKGANRSIKNKKNQTPLQIAIQNNFKNISRMLNNKFNFCDMIKFYCNVKIQYRPRQRNIQIPIVFLITLFLCIGLTNVLIELTYQYGYYIEGVLFSILLLLYLSLLWPPKKYPPNKDIQVILSQLKNPYCFDCIRPIPKRGYHCDTCRTCIRQYDHHCTWINNCVGKKNIARFIIFLIFLLLGLGYVGLLSVTAIISQITQNNQTFGQWFMVRQFKNEEEYYRYLKIGLFCITGVISTFFFPVLLLLMVQLKNLCMNKTTFQRFTKNSIDSPDTIKNQMKSKKKQKKSYAKNCKIMCSSTRQSFSSVNSMEQQLTGQQ